MDYYVSVRIICSLNTWSGKDYRIILRNLVNVSNNRMDIYSTCVYILFKKNAENENTAYMR